MNGFGVILACTRIALNWGGLVRAFCESGRQDMAICTKSTIEISALICVFRFGDLDCLNLRSGFLRRPDQRFQTVMDDFYQINVFGYALEHFDSRALLTGSSSVR